jgi:hypothetical protein
MPEKTIAEKLLIKPTSTVWVSDPDRLAIIGPMPDGAAPAESLGAASVAVLFADDAASLRSLAAAHATELSGPPVLWALYPKGNRTDINRDSLYPILTPYGIRPNGQVSVDDVWSALRFRPNKPGEARFTGGKG